VYVVGVRNVSKMMVISFKGEKYERDYAKRPGHFGGKGVCPCCNHRTTWEPQSNPVWFDWDGIYVRFSQAKSKQKYRNLQQDARIALSILDPENPYHYLEIRGKVVRVEDDPDYRFINGVTKKYLDVDTYPHLQPGEERIVLVVQPEYTTSQ